MPNFFASGGMPFDRGSTYGKRTTVFTPGSLGGSGQQQALPFLQAFGNAPIEGMTPAQRALQNFQSITGGPGSPWGTAQQMLTPQDPKMGWNEWRKSGMGDDDAYRQYRRDWQQENQQRASYDPTRTLQEAQAWAAIQAAQNPLLAQQADPVRQATEEGILDQLQKPPTYLQEQARAAETAAMRQLEDDRAAGRVSDLEYRDRRRQIGDQSRRNISQLTQAGRQQALNLASNFNAQQAAIRQQGVNGLLSVLQSIVRGEDDGGFSTFAAGLGELGALRGGTAGGADIGLNVFDRSSGTAQQYTGGRSTSTRRIGSIAGLGAYAARRVGGSPF